MVVNCFLFSSTSTHDTASSLSTLSSLVWALTEDTTFQIWYWWSSCLSLLGYRVTNFWIVITPYCIHVKAFAGSFSLKPVGDVWWITLRIYCKQNMSLNHRFLKLEELIVITIPSYCHTECLSLQPCSWRCTAIQAGGVDRSVWTTVHRGKRPEMDVGFGLWPDKCYSEPVKAKFVSRNSSLPTAHLILNYLIIVCRERNMWWF